jgi:hypothetical protein
MMVGSTRLLCCCACETVRHDGNSLTVQIKKSPGESQTNSCVKETQ